MFVECLIIYMCKYNSTAWMICAVLSEFLLCLDKKIVTENRQIHFLYWCIEHPEGVLHLMKKKKVKAICGSYSTAALRHIVLLPE